VIEPRGANSPTVTTAIFLSFVFMEFCIDWYVHNS
jgi:hypothetical protein